MGFSLRQFSQVFKIRDADGKPYVLIGGQAVNYWAERYLTTEANLKNYSHSPAMILTSKVAARMSCVSPGS